ncbi:hypothetical protein [Edaphobacter aggregans]|uniref:hypothetical protein n=1 Tax=Edaphobacter aggregans TaxID=570835 RepID=UPI0012FAB82A|nr:hypothetical protein [Edaphobacter aggregans]
MMVLGRFQSNRNLLVLWLTLGLAAFVWAQKNGGTNPKDTTPQQAQQKSAPLTPAEQRRADLLADTEKLYQLTQELKAEVAKSNKDTLSVSVVKKAQEVERLAKSIKERSKAQ